MHPSVFAVRSGDWECLIVSRIDRPTTQQDATRHYTHNTPWHNTYNSRRDNSTRSGIKECAQRQKLRSADTVGVGVSTKTAVSLCL
ncbi:hypothetical protein J6590_019601 [Homalodisca vitripennis]|nr:hypothetical protein J6590_019601 [Homalodisca vitripennis]